MEKNVLLEKWNKLIEVKSAKAVPDDLKEQMAQLLENQEGYISEGSVAGDMAQFTPILIPAVRRIFPGLLAHDIVGVQPLNAPTGYAYALRYSYAGDGTNPTEGVQGAATTTGPDRGFYSPPTHGTPGAAMGGPTWTSYAAIVDDPTPAVVGTTIEQGTIAGNSGVDIGTVMYSEPGRCLINFSDTTAPGDPLPAAGSVFNDGTTDFTVSYSMNNEAGYNLIFKNYSGYHSTTAGETLGAADMKAMKMSLERVAVEAQTRKLKAEYTIELAQDLKNVHGHDAETELINILEYEITAELDRELIDQINGVATLAAPWAYGVTGQGFGNPAGDVAADGRWEQEKFRTLYTKILRESNMIALTTRRGAGNFIVGSINAISALEGLSSFMYSAVPGSVTMGAGVVKVGTLDGRFNVYVDTFSAVDYVTVGYKGPSQFDTGVIYCPYVPLMMQKVVDPETFQPKVGFMQRSTYVNNLFGAANYYRSFLTDFAGSSMDDVPLYF
jgi:hypothetical protein